MPTKNIRTEELIRATVKRLIFAEGKLHATTQEIADAAIINRAALNYYFRSRDQMISVVFHEAMQDLSRRLDDCLGAEKPFKEKVEGLIEVFLKEMIAFPYQETFLVTEINMLGLELMDNIQSKPISDFLIEIWEQMDLGIIEKTNPLQFLMNLFSLLSYPLIMAPLYKRLFQIPDQDFNLLIQNRKSII